MEQRSGHKICLVSLCQCPKNVLHIHLVCYDEDGQRIGTVLCAGYPLLLTDFNQNWRVLINVSGSPQKNQSVQPFFELLNSDKCTDTRRYGDMHVQLQLVNSEWGNKNVHKWGAFAICNNESRACIY
jgi:hypothetical protein